MPIEAKVRDYRGVERVDLELAPIALVGGRNGSGKTSMAQAIAAVVTGELLPVRKVNKGTAGLLVRAGREAGAATVQTDTGTARVDWPACTRRTDKEPPEASAYAAGLRSIVDDGVDRVETLSELLHALPTIEDLVVGLGEFPRLASREVADAVWELISTSGWDAAHEARRIKGAELKGRWRQVTGQNYGSQRAAAWRPDLAEIDETAEQLQQRVDTARAVLESAIATTAVSDEARRALQALADEHDARDKALQEADAAFEAADKAVADATAARLALPAASSGGVPEYGCPHCGGMVIITKHDLVETRLEAAPTAKIGDDELKRRRLAIADADGTIANRTDAANVARQAQRAARDRLAEAVAAQATLDDSTPAAAAPADVGALRQAVTTAEKRRDDARTWRDAEAIRLQIDDNDNLLGILAPDGLRAKKLARVVDVFNQQVAGLCTLASWRPVTLGAELDISYGGRPYGLLSASEQFRVRVVLQVALARLDGSLLVIVDGADILDAQGRSDLFELLFEVNIPAIVTMTLRSIEAVPDLGAAGMGQSYWIERGICAAIDASREVAA